MDTSLQGIERALDERRTAPADKKLRFESSPGETRSASNSVHPVRIPPWTALGISAAVVWILGSFIRRNRYGKVGGHSAEAPLDPAQAHRPGILMGLVGQILWHGVSAAVLEQRKGLRSAPESERAGRNGKENNTIEASAASVPAEKQRGREAERPTDIPRPGWRDVLFRVKDEMTKDNLSIVAAGVAFYAFMAIFPAIAALVSIYGLFTSPADLQSHLQILESILPRDAAEVINTELKRVVDNQESSLGWGALVGIALALWSATKGVSSLFEAMNIAYDEEEKRGFLKLNATALLVTFGAILFVIVFLGLVVGVPIFLNTIGLGETGDKLLNYLRWPLLTVAGMFALAVLYRFGPSRNQPQWKWVSPGAVTATVVWLLASALFSFYVSHFASYNATYGSLGVVVILMMWFFLSVYSVLLGAEINAELERQTVKDTTVGEPKPLGSRGAYAADTVGAAH